MGVTKHLLKYLSYAGGHTLTLTLRQLTGLEMFVVFTRETSPPTSTWLTDLAVTVSAGLLGLQTPALALRPQEAALTAGVVGAVLV